jgi:DNA-binding FrmR family transcriptional regulator
MKTDRKELINHISRLEGQLASVKAALSVDQPDCVTASKTLHSAARSFAGLREQFIETFLYAHFIDKEKMKDEKLFTQLLTLIKS